MATSAAPATGPTRVPAPSWVKWTGVGIGIGAAAGSLAAAVTSGAATYFARRVVTPLPTRAEDQEILAVISAGAEQQVILRANDDTVVPGRYSLFFDGGRGHAVVGAVRSYVPREGTVLRVVERVYSGDLSAARRGYWSGAVYADPAAVGLAEEEVQLALENGSAPAWLVRAENDAQNDAETWAIMVHGRGASRMEGLRAVRPARDLGMTSLVISYRNDGEAPAAEDGRYGLGMTEWRDVDAAIEYALANGAADVVLFGWSMGGAICLQTVDRSRHRQRIRALVLDAPVVDWVDVLAHQAELNRIPSVAGRLGQLLISHPLGRRLTGLAAPLDLKSMDWVTRAEELRTPTLIVHSVDDEFVPYGPSQELALRNPQIVTFVPFHGALHTKEWNVDPQRWETVVTSWLAPRLRASRPGSQATA